MEPTYILIDTNIWLDLLKNELGDQMLIVLERYINHGQLKVLLPRLIREEWENHYRNYIAHTPDEKLLQRFETVVKALASQHEQSKFNLINRIETLFKGSVEIEISDEVKILSMDRYLNKQAPFHGKDKSNNDSMIYFSALEWAEKNEIQKILFVTKNKTDFSDPKDPKKLHPQLAIGGMEVGYYTEIISVLKSFDENCLSSETNLKSSFIPIIVDELITNETIVNQWYRAFEYYFKHLHSIPRSVLSLLYPMVLNEEMPIGHSSSGIYLNNHVLIDFLKSLPKASWKEMDDSQSKSTIEPDEHAKLKEIFKKLNGSQIDKLNVFKPRYEFECIVKTNSVCECIRCTFRQLAFNKLDEKLITTPGNKIAENNRQGYVRYLIGDYLLSAQFYRRVYDQATRENLLVIKLIAAQNLEMLLSKVKRGYQPSEIPLHLHKLLPTESDQVFTANLFQDAFIKEASKLVYGNHFMLVATNRIVELHKKIKNHYYAQLSGSTSSNSNLLIIGREFNELKNFCEINSIISHYTVEAFTELYDSVLESYLMCHEFCEGESSRLSYFNDHLLFEIANYADPETLRKFLLRLNIKKLRYSYPEGGISRFVAATVTLLKEYTHLTSSQTGESKSHHMRNFQRLYFNTTSNCLALCSLLCLTPQDDQMLMDALSHTIVAADSNRAFYKDIHGGLWLLGTKGKHLTDRHIELMIGSVMNTKDWAKRSWQEGLGTYVSENRMEVLSGNFELSRQVLKMIMESIDLKSQNEFVTYYQVWLNALHPEHSKEISTWVCEQLAVKFEPELYYDFAIHGIIDYRLFFNEFLDSVKLPERDETDFIQQRFALSDSLSALINLVFKNGIDTTSGEFDRFFHYQPYYDWLLNLDGFDYSQFKNIWVLEYQTMFYMKAIFRSAQATEAIRKGLIESPNKNIASNFLIYSKQESDLL